ncbi:sn-glycerol-3-phosphate ABC transporter permease UgpE [Brucella melitensis]|uniref:Uncharacterized protein n=4 Tax=Brucella TaxID=234 RepID=C0RE22_BRUMB|nr:hypothetical protein BR1382 [Brucella suis 1330]ABX62444.1 Hypothetical protein, conserved [Brucella canis ATCC 23365]ACO01144.1 Hypothetical protein, conserved [Brucella melitensis ATCC 23457]ADZ66469.1 conserved hypothetical protein [Brucella melitensis M28]AEK54688.1 hypothetical protein BPI_I1432 [Brucella pinnipedialis B2/94]AEU06379.1 hypothetical protein BSVBI22_A1376 [Brucella suis VBI22]AHN46997.1 hypothetical protein BSS2_I1342 [Brucella suis bv. 1 str. S2]AUS54355.1 sn-glycerol
MPAVKHVFQKFRIFIVKFFASRLPGRAIDKKRLSGASERRFFLPLFLRERL